MARDGGGLAGSWSWSESNFHKDDVPDITYTDPMFTPAYTLDGVSPHMIYQGNMHKHILGTGEDLMYT